MKKDLQNGHVEIVEVNDTRVAVLEHRGDPEMIGDSVRHFINWRKDTGLPAKTSATFNILYDDPSNTLPQNFRIDLCAATGRDVLPNSAGIVIKTIPGGRCALLRHLAPMTVSVKQCLTSTLFGCRRAERSHAISHSTVSASRSFRTCLSMRLSRTYCSL